LEKLEKASENPEIIPQLEAEVNAGGKASMLSTEKVSKLLLYSRLFFIDLILGWNCIQIVVW
jgi:hypothetical protein